MARIIVLDAHPLGLASNDPRKPDAARCYQWIRALDVAGAVIVAPEIADFEVRRELLRVVGAAAGIQRLDRLLKGLLYAPINRATMRLAAEYWAFVRRAGLPTAPDNSLDADCIVAAQASLVTGLGDVMTIATLNPNHLTRFPGIDARAVGEDRPIGQAVASRPTLGWESPPNLGDHGFPIWLWPSAGRPRRCERHDGVPSS